MMMRYAANTAVTPERSRSEIEKVLSRYGATGFMYGWSGDNAVLCFEMHDRRIQFELLLPSPNDFSRTETGRSRKTTPMNAACEQAKKQRWRALALVIKAKLEAVESGITVFEEEFLAHIVMPDGMRVGQHVLPHVGKAYETGKMQKLLPHIS